MFTPIQTSDGIHMVAFFNAGAVPPWATRVHCHLCATLLTAYLNGTAQPAAEQLTEPLRPFRPFGMPRHMP